MLLETGTRVRDKKTGHTGTVGLLDDDGSILVRGLSDHPSFQNSALVYYEDGVCDDPREDMWVDSQWLPIEDLEVL